jgi:hypothetical protein
VKLHIDSRSLCTVVLFAIALSALAIAAVPASAQQTHRDCADFPSQAAAQAALDATFPEDLERLDADNDGLACEDFDYATQDDDTGDGNAAETQYNATDAQYKADGKEVTIIIDTIPDKKILVDTGGPSLPMIGGLFLALGLVGFGLLLLQRT